ncbi:MAG TPA: DUF1385 domain-containing protein [Armatimonadota bacterium]|jgi:uncharacterized protein YqhQ
MPEHEEQHFYGGQAVLEGVMMRGTDRYGIAVRRTDGEVVTTAEPLQGLAVKEGWHKWPLIRGNYMLVESMALGMKALQFSADVLTAEESEKAAAETAASAPLPAGEAATVAVAVAEAHREEQQSAGTPLARIWIYLSTAFAFVLGIGLFIVLPTAIPGWIYGPATHGVNADSIKRNLVEGGIRLLVIVAYILAISLMKYVKRVFQYHGAEHSTINCYEGGLAVTVQNCLGFSPLHPRCGTAFLLVVIVVKILVGCFFGWPVAWLRITLRLASLPLVAGIAYEVLRWAGRHRSSVLARIMAYPGLALQKLTTRRPDAEQVQVAIYALAAVAPEIPLPADFPTPRRVDLRLQPVEQEVA